MADSHDVPFASYTPEQWDLLLDYADLMRLQGEAREAAARRVTSGRMLFADSAAPPNAERLVQELKRACLAAGLRREVEMVEAASAYPLFHFGPVVHGSRHWHRKAAKRHAPARCLQPHRRVN